MSLPVAILLYLWIAGVIDGVVLWQLVKYDVHPLIAIPLYLVATTALAILCVWAVLLTTHT